MWSSPRVASDERAKCAAGLITHGGIYYDEQTRDLLRGHRVSGRDGSMQLVAGVDRDKTDGCVDGHATTEAAFNEPNGLLSRFDPSLGPVLYVCDFHHSRLRRIELKTEQVTTVDTKPHFRSRPVWHRRLIQRLERCCTV